MASAQLGESFRPETDYERWLREQDRHYRPGSRPVYGPDRQNLDDSIANGKWRGRFSEGTGLNCYSVMWNIVLSILLIMVIIKTARSCRKRRQQGGISFSGKTGDKIRNDA
ncbi:hypothetical protein BDV27DRAFT_126675 [Aspergillus caelatus]|uniref:Uncharacterized protein n=1 Tax=Aspergillus caelatus TaxID=61420 RepID=A0A5N7AA81_9EURO|nr:uncharacterized protein BDV27DRAFT_126675 [Aspergillus caelatus]KAE8365510.1 hypothetical protein BDV27DRAFT_126675 [Aspergillus caelatus]